MPIVICSSLVVNEIFLLLKKKIIIIRLQEGAHGLETHSLAEILDLSVEPPVIMVSNKSSVGFGYEMSAHFPNSNLNIIYLVLVLWSQRLKAHRLPNDLLDNASKVIKRKPTSVYNYIRLCACPTGQGYQSFLLVVAQSRKLLSSILYFSVKDRRF